MGFGFRISVSVSDFGFWISVSDFGVWISGFFGLRISDFGFNEFEPSLWNAVPHLCVEPSPRSLSDLQIPVTIHRVYVQPYPDYHAFSGNTLNSIKKNSEINEKGKTLSLCSSFLSFLGNQTHDMEFIRVKQGT